MPSYIFEDYFNSYSPGPGIPTGFQGQGIVFTSQFIDTSVGPPPTPAPGFYERTGKIYELFGTISYPVNANLAFTGTLQTSVWWETFGFGNTSFSPVLLNLTSTDPAHPTSQLSLLTILIESDGSLSGLVPGAGKKNTLSQVWFPLTWQMFQVRVSLGNTLIGGVSYIVVTYYVAVDGVVVLNNVIAITNVPVASTWDGAGDVNQWNFTGSPNGQILGMFAATATLETIPSFVSPATTIHSLASQLVVEQLKLPSNQKGRVSQLIVEQAKFPSNRNARVSQIIVELMRKNTPTGGGWLTKEA